MEGGYVPCPDEMRERCPVFEKEGRCYEDTHHEYWPAKRYRGKTEKDFIRLVINQTVMCRNLHNKEHQKPPPEKPTIQEMQEVINANTNDRRDGRVTD